jgi:hypothetical protein
MSPHAWYRRVLHGHRVGGHIGDALGGQLYEARELAGGHAATIDVIDASVAAAPGFRGRFERDVALLGSFAHPHVVALRGAGQAGGATYLVLDPLDGPTLAELIAVSGPLDPGRVVELVAQLATALDAAHQRGLVHRGLSPASIVVRERGAVEQAAIMDFAVADDTALYGGLFERPEGTAPPPIDYAAPEQVRGRPSGPRTDVYALGAILFHALTARPPFTGLTPGATLEAHLHEPVPSARALVAALAPGFDEVLARALAKDPADRFASASELAGALPSTRAALSSWRSMLADAVPDEAGEDERAPFDEVDEGEDELAPFDEADAGEDEMAPFEELTAGDTVEWDVEAAEPRSAPPAVPSYHFQTARAYDPPAARVNYGPEEPGLSDADDPLADDLGAGVRERPGASGIAASGGPPAEDRDVVAAFELTDDEIDLDDYEELPDDIDLEGFEDATRASPHADPASPDPDAGAAVSTAAGARDERRPVLAGVAAAPAAGESDGRQSATARSLRRRQGRERRPPDLEPIEPPVRSPSRRRRRRRRGPKPALLIAAGLLLLAVTSVLAAAGAFDGGGSGHDRASGPTIATTANSEADALARLRGATKKKGSRRRRGAAASGSGSASGATTTGSGTGATPATATTGSAPGAATGSGAQPGGASPGAGTTATATVPANLSWPAGRSAYTAVVYVSPTDRATAVQSAERAARLGVRTGVLRSSDFANLEPGMWVAFAGVSDTEGAAQRIADRLRAAGLAPAPYTRRVESG